MKSSEKKPEAPEPEFKVGDRLATNRGTYEIQRLLGVGGMGAVYQVVSDEDFGGRQYALKTILPEYAISEANVSRFEEEGRTVSKYRHKNVIRIEGVLYLTGTEPRRPLILMELLEGCTLRNLFDAYGTDEFTVFDLCSIAIGVCNALTYIHDKGIIHRDVKPENIFVEKTDNDGRIVLLDFGIMRNALAPGIETMGPRHHTEGHFVGTFANASPEQLLGKPVTKTSDIYSLGTVLYELVARRPLFPDLTEQRDVGQAHIDRIPVSLHEIASPHYPRELLDVIMQALSKEPEKRPKDAYNFIDRFATRWRQLFVETAKSGLGQSTFNRMLTNTVAGDRWPLVSGTQGVPGVAASAKGSTERMAPSLAARPPTDTTAPCGPPLGGTESGGRKAPSAPFVEVVPIKIVSVAASPALAPAETASPLDTSANIAGSPSPAAEPATPAGALVNDREPEPRRISLAVQEQPVSARTMTPALERLLPARAMTTAPLPQVRRVRRSIDDVPITTATGLPEGPSTDPTSTQSVRPKTASADARDGDDHLPLPLTRARTPMLAAVVAASALVIGGYTLVHRAAAGRSEPESGTPTAASASAAPLVPPRPPSPQPRASTAPTALTPVTSSPPVTSAAATSAVASSAVTSPPVTSAAATPSAKPGQAHHSPTPAKPKSTSDEDLFQEVHLDQK